MTPPRWLAALWTALNTPLHWPMSPSRFVDRHELLTLEAKFLALEKRLMAADTALSDRITALTAAVSQVTSDVAVAVAEITDLQAKQAAGTATPDELKSLDDLTANIRALHATLAGVLPAPTPTDAPHG